MPKGKSTPSKDDQRPTNETLNTMDFEQLKLQADTIKHASTMATGTIVILATFMDKLPKPLTDPKALIIAVILLLVCLGCSFVALYRMTIFRFQLRSFLPILQKEVPR